MRNQRTLARGGGPDGKSRDSRIRKEIETGTQREKAEKSPRLSHTAFIGIGSNMGNRLAFCQKAISALKKTADVQIVSVSSLYETDPVDFLNQEKFLNAVAQLKTSLTPHRLLKQCQKIERSLGKEIKVSKGPRTIDLDLLFYDALVLTSPDLVLPHPGAVSRDFVLIPFLEITPETTSFPFPQPLKNRFTALRNKNLEHIQKRYPPGWEKSGKH